ncbi:nicotinate-nucleotide--dimethylbenzimidazole phosphoribosyltransferase [Corynebacterium striatum]|uniref:nicotinate-nucleotide--dimethylbenzimidazole phosphoribosyltransferase n=1 Tax=Corynebacterium striatum TaxID=43770 RepID=UPI00191D3658|nr:nicotinate-nucleotide--dimethylbenzimidazole phosphoribosyltransferase [Corynebacterium striatum]QQU79325.1 nicotinate-nucleotide--dimethylbenzimidazole phosphoribosyltransferase [Corynebacterium striatum]
MPEITPVPRPDQQARLAVADALSTSVRGDSFGTLNDVASWLAACQGVAPAAPLQRTRVIVFAGAHGIATRTFEGVGLSAFAPESDAEQLTELAEGAGPAHTMARRTGASIHVVECAPSGSIDVEPAMSTEEFDAAFTLGQTTADAEIDAGADLLIPAELGVGGTSVAAVLMGNFTATEPVVIVGPGSGTTDAMWKTKVTVIRDAMFHIRNLDGIEVIKAASSPSFAALVGFMCQAAARRTPMLIDGPLTATAAVYAEKLAPGVKHWLYAASATTEPSHIKALELLKLQPLLELRMRAGQGLAALSALPLIDAAVELAGDELAVLAAAESNESQAPATEYED